MEFSNSDKSKHGKSVQDSIEQILNRCQDNGYIVNYKREYRIGKAGYSNNKQFYTPFLICFDDNTKWALFSTTSMRTDRIKGQQWDALHLKELDSTIKKVFLVYADSTPPKDKIAFLKQNQKYIDKVEYSEIDEILSQDEISTQIEAYAIRNKTNGQIKDIQGKSFEYKIANLLDNEQNLKKWKNSDARLVGMHYDVFIEIVSFLCINASKVEEIKATSDIKIIGRLPSGGYPKTDVLMTVKYTNGAIKHFTISCKRSSMNSVSIHQYSADSFTDVLDKSNHELRDLLSAFQKCGAPTKFDRTEELTSALKPFVEKLALWALGGIGGDGDPEKQIAKYIITYDNNDRVTKINTIEGYYKHLIDNNVVGNFGTPFKWTYASGQLGKSIQLKCKII